jgi:alkanesulfonate monooxygenase SsuD/methylene tetrahydromethanopterin reductase-like flavin-dependent oxidoreductase (luciferase family)
MRVWYFSENAYPYLPDGLDNLRVTLPNRLFNPKIGAELYSRYFDEWQLADEEGLDLMCNEHHQTAINLNPAAPLVMAVLARITKRARLLVLGNPIANRRDPVRVAEEMAMIDNYSRGRLEVGFVRGVPYEISAANANPVRTMDRLWEAHDLIVKAWTSHDAPFNWEGRYFHHRQVNVWPRPYQEPHPPIWITSLTPSSMVKIAEHGYTTATFLTGVGPTKTGFDAYRKRRHELNLPMAEDRLAYSGIVYVGDTDAEGYEGARKIMWVITHNLAALQFKIPPGYAPARARLQVMRGTSGLLHGLDTSIEALIDRGIAFAGNPDTVYRQIERHYRAVGGYGHLLMLGQSGFLEHDDTEKGIRRFAREVYPRLKALRVEPAQAAQIAR